MSQSSESLESPSFAQLVGLFFISCATLLLQITWTRILSVSLWYHFAFLIVSTALLGFGLSGVLLAVSRRLQRVELERALLVLSAAQVATIVFGFVVANQIPFAPFALARDPWQLLYGVCYVLCLAAPFVCAGLCVALLLSRRTAHASRIYFFDLLGAGVGCLVIVAVMPIFGGSGSILVCAALCGLGTVAFARKRARLVWALVPLVLVALAPLSNRLLPLRVSPLKRESPTATMQEVLESPANLYTGWNTFSRIDVLPSRYGREILIDAGTAITRMPLVDRPPEAMGPITDERRLALDPTARQAVLIIGSGGGWDVLAALRGQARRVVAVEINPLINELVTGSMAAFVGKIFDDPRVELHTDEARSFIRRSTEKFDAILATHTISNAATASGALSLAENYIITVEAFADYLAHLTSEGRLFLTRPEAQLPRLMATALAALEARGARRAGDHLVVFAGPDAPSFSGGLLVSNAPLSRQAAQQAAAQLRAGGLRLLYLPGQEGQGIYARLGQASPAQRQELYARSEQLLVPPTDDRPFFNHRSRWSSVPSWGRALAGASNSRMALEQEPLAELVLLAVLGQAVVLSLLLIALPLLWKQRRGARGTAPLLGYFFCLGLGFILAEIALIQRLTLFLGQPVYTFATVVGALLITSGVGSLLSHRVGTGPGLHRWLLAVLAGIAALLLLTALAIPPLLGALLGWPLPARVLLTVLVVAPLGLSMGVAFPLGLRHAGELAPGVIPWAWGLNAIASVVGSVLAIIWATQTGFSGVFLIAAGVYLLAAGCWLLVRILPRAPAVP